MKIKKYLFGGIAVAAVLVVGAVTLSNYNGKGQPASVFDIPKLSTLAAQLKPTVSPSSVVQVMTSGAVGAPLAPAATCTSSTPPITVTLDSATPGAGTYVAGSLSNDFGHFDIHANCPVVVTGLKATPNWLTGQYSITNPPASNYGFYRGTTLIANSGPTVTGISNTSGFFAIPAGQTVVVTVKLDLTAQTTAKALQILLGVTTNRNTTAINSPDASWFKITSGTAMCPAGTVQGYSYLRQWAIPANSTSAQPALQYGMAINPAGNIIYVSGRYNNYIQEFTLQGQFITQWQGSGSNQLDAPEGIAFGPNGNLYVVDNLNNRIEEFTPSGQYVTQWGALGSGSGQFNLPIGIAINQGTGNIYVGDYQNNRIQEFTSNGTYITQWGTNGNGNGQFSVPWGITLDSNGNVYVVDQGNRRVQEFTSNGTYITQWGTYGNGNGQFVIPYALLINSGNIFVTDAWGPNLARVQEFSMNGTYLNYFGSPGTGNGQFDGPDNIISDSAGDLYVSDAYNDRIQEFAPTACQSPTPNLPASLSVIKNNSLANPTYQHGSNLVHIGSFTLSNASGTNSVQLQNIQINLSSPTLASTDFSSLEISNSGSSATPIMYTYPVTPVYAAAGATSVNIFNNLPSLTITTGAPQTIDVYANVGALAGTLTTSLIANGVTPWTGATVPQNGNGNPVVGQTTTIQ